MCKRCQEMTPEERGASEKRISDGVMGIFDALANAKNPLETAGELTEAICAFVHASDGVLAPQGFTRTVIDGLLDVMQMRAETANEMNELREALRTGRAVAVPVGKGQGPAFAMNSSSEPTKLHETPETPGMFL